MPNVKLLRETLAHIEAEPEKWDQSVYRCETGMCFAGWAVTLDGGRWKTRPDEDGHALLVAEAEDDEISRKMGDIHAADRAHRILGLTDGQADALFEGDNTLDDLRAIVNAICEGRLI